MSLFGNEDEIQKYKGAFNNSWSLTDPIDQVRFISLDCETTGLDPKKDAVVTIGAVAIEDGQIVLEDQFDVMLKVAYNTSSVVVHGVTREESEHEGLDEVEALRLFLGYLRDGVIVGHHIGFDVEILSAACMRRFGFSLMNRWLDTMELTLHLDDSGLFEKTEERPDFSLDGLCRRFNIVPHGRHTAGGDAFITAQIYLKLMRMAKKSGRADLGAISERYEARD